MQSDSDCETLERTDENTAISRQQLHDLTTLMAQLRQFLVRNKEVLKEEGVLKEIEKLEHWLEAERGGPAPAGIISESGIVWLAGLRDQLKLSADEALRLEDEGGNPASKEQTAKNEELLKAVRRIDRIINESCVCKPH